MNRFTLTIILACLISLPAAQAADENDHATHHPGDDQSQTNPAQDDATTGMQMQEMQDRMKTMRELMSKIHATSDQQERKKLMQEHMTSMREGMKSMRSMMGSDSMMGERQHDG
jgi:hypothetical protein